MSANFPYTVEVHCIVWNEEIILPHFMRHYRDKFGAQFVFYDNGSTDNTIELAKDFGARVLRYDTGGLLHDGVYLMIKNDVYRKGWKESKSWFVIVCDADEFLEVDFDINEHRDASIIKTAGYDMIGDFDSRIGVRNKMYDKLCMFSPHRVREMNYRPGCHSCEASGDVVLTENTAKLLHRKYTTPEYLYAKHSAYSERLSKFNKERGFGIEYVDVTMEKIQAKFDELNSKAINVDEHHARHFPNRS